MLLFVVFLFLSVSSGIIIYQDFKDRLVSLWVLVLFATSCLISVIYIKGIEVLLYHGISVFFYLFFLWIMLKLYLYLKYRRNVPIINNQFGMADLIVVASIGLTFNFIGLIFFFCSGFIFSLFAFLIYNLIAKNKRVETIPLAGILVFYYLSCLIMLHLFRIDLLVDCSFVNHE